MRKNFSGGVTLTGGAGAVTVSAAFGLALPSSVFSENHLVEYSIIEYSDATRSTVSRAETGWGNVDALNVLTRTSPRSTWDGSSYNDSAPTPLNFGVAHVSVIVAPIAEGGSDAIPAVLDLNGESGGVVAWAGNFAITDGSDYGAATGLAAGAVYVSNFQHKLARPISSLMLVVTAAAAAGSTANCALATVDPTNGKPGRIVFSANGIPIDSTGQKVVSVGPKFIPPGWYYSLVTLSGGAGIRGFLGSLGGPLGLYISARTLRYLYFMRAYSDFVVGADALDGKAGSWSSVINLSSPSFFIK